MRAPLALARRQRRIRIDRCASAFVRGWPMREIVVYERDGRYYRECDDRDDRWSDQRRDRDYDEDRNWD